MQNIPNLPHLTFTKISPKDILNLKNLDIEQRLLVSTAKELGVKVEILPDTESFKFTHNNKSYYFRLTFPTTSLFANKVSKNKAAVKQLFKENNISVSKGYIISQNDNDDYIQEVFSALQTPLVIKPTNNTHGHGVHMNINSLTHCLEVIKNIFKSEYFIEGYVLIEEQFSGKEFRILTNREKVLAVMHRLPCSVTGDGSHTIKELISIENENPLRNIDPYLYPHITWDEEMAAIVSEQQLTGDSIPDIGKTIRLRYVSNIMAGGVAVDYTDLVHPSIKEIALKAINAIPGLEFAGMDYITKDETVEQVEGKYNIIEINSAPGFTMHDIPMQGTSRGVAKEFIFMMFPELRS